MAKAFDLVNHYALYLKLMMRQVPACFIYLLSDWYKKVFISVKWGQSLSKQVRLTTGVRQGGILFPVLFALYVNDIITSVENSGYDCEIANKCVGILMCADDLLLISVTSNGLRRLIEICEREMAWLDMQFNSRKLCIITCGSRRKKEYADAFLNGVPLRQCKSFKYVGIVFGLEAVSLSNANMATLQSTWRVALYKIFHVRDINNLLYIQRCLDILPIGFVVDLRKMIDGTTAVHNAHGNGCQCRRHVLHAGIEINTKYKSHFQVIFHVAAGPRRDNR